MLSEHQVSQTFIHPLYNTTTSANDIAILGLATDIVFSSEFIYLYFLFFNTINNAKNIEFA